MTCSHYMVIVDMIGRCKWCDLEVDYRELQAPKKGLPKTYRDTKDVFRNLGVAYDYPNKGHVELPMEINKYYVDEYALTDRR